MRNLIAAFLCCWTAFGTELGPPLPRAHAHNDYEHKRPLWDALANGFCSIEADIYLRNGSLLVAHDESKLTEERSLERLYFVPLKKLAGENGGRVYRGGPSLALLIDIKSDADETYHVLQKLLENYESILTRFKGNTTLTNAVTVILSGNRPRNLLLSESDRLAAFDGRLSDLGQKLPLSFMPLISDNWRNHFRWNGTDKVPAEEKAKLRDLVNSVHAEKRLIRFWGAPDTDPARILLYESGVDLLNTDDLPGMAGFLQKEAR